jgi:type II secretory ATPase GspE/PulE/Tfp pilus assembly ATPase PilB-like protein
VAIKAPRLAVDFQRDNITTAAVKHLPANLKLFEPEKINPVQLLPSKNANLSIINLLDKIIERAQERNASDVHIDPGKNEVRVRLRVDGVLEDSEVFPKSIHPEIISRIKILSGMRTDEHQAAQDGRFRFNEQAVGQPLDVRVSVMPTYYGENAVLRLLSDRTVDFSLEDMGFSATNREKILAAVKKPYGMILATGPTGSGKTTTLYTLIRMLNSRQSSIVTVEDPIEYSLEGVNQTQINARTGLTFANGLRSILRQDPNIIMVGEIRDRETAGLAVNTALTGHLLLSTLHTNDAATTLPRLLDLNVEPYLIASTVNIAIGQRLLRKICAYCRAPKQLLAGELKSLSGVLDVKNQKPLPQFFFGTGCEKCANSGYMGRVGVYEVLVLDQPVREAILRKATASEIQALAVKQGMVSMFGDGLEKARAGITTIEEVLRMLYE